MPEVLTYYHVYPAYRCDGHVLSIHKLADSYYFLINVPISKLCCFFRQFYVFDVLAGYLVKYRSDLRRSIFQLKYG